ncbi:MULTISPECIES: hypothetical protein [unclassified Modestobacter]
MTSSAPRPTGTERLDLHNASIDESAAAAGHCGMTDLHDGRVCQEPQDHAGSCGFVAPSPGPAAAALGDR